MSEEGHLHWVRGQVPESLRNAVHRSPLIEAEPRRALFRLATVGRFLVRPGEPTVVEPSPDATDTDIECFIRGPVAALACFLRGEFSLRGAAAEVRGGAVVACGTSCGTSSLVANLALRGHPVIADSVVCVGGKPPHAAPLGEAGSTSVTLWPDSVTALGLDPKEGTPVRPALAPRAFHLGPPKSRDRVRVAALVLLDQDNRLGGGNHLVAETVAGFRAVGILLQYQWHTRLARDLGMERDQFEWATDLAKAVPFTVLSWGTGKIGQTLPALVEQAERLVA